MDNLFVHYEVPHGLNTLFTMCLTPVSIGVPRFTQSGRENIISAKNIENPH